MMKEKDSEERLLLPWYVSGRLDEDQRLDVEKEVDQNPLMAAEADWLESLRTQMRASAPSRREDAGLERLLARIDAEREGKVSTLPSGTGGWRPRWFNRGFAIAASIILAQAVVIAVQLEKAGSDQLQPLAASGPMVKGALLQVVFQESVTEAQMRAALNAIQGEIVAGPGVLGVYLVRVEPQAVEVAILRLKKSGAVESVTREGEK